MNRALARGLLPPVLGAVSVAGFAPFGLHPLPVVALALWLLWRPEGVRAAFVHGWLFGLGLGIGERAQRGTVRPRGNLDGIDAGHDRTGERDQTGKLDRVDRKNHRPDILVGLHAAQRLEQDPFVRDVIPGQRVLDPLPGQIAGGVPALPVFVHVMPGAWHVFHHPFIGRPVPRRTHALAEQGRMMVQGLFGFVEIHAEPQGGSSPGTKNGLTAPGRSPPVAGGLGKEIQGTAEPSFLESKGVLRDGVAPDDRHRLEFRFQIADERTLHAPSRFPTANLHSPYLTDSVRSKMKTDESSGL